METEDLTVQQILELLNSSMDNLTPESRQRVRDHLLEQVIEKARNDFYTFVLIMAPHCLPEEFVSGRHIEVICKELQKIEQYVIQTRKGTLLARKTHTGRLQIFLPPGSMKSILGSRLFSAWVLGRHPKWRLISVGHSRDFAIDNVGRPVRDLMASEEYKEIFPEVGLKEDISSAGRWETGKGGQFYCAGAGTRIAGRRAHIAIVDDVISEQEAESKGQRDKINRWYGKGLQSRLLPGAAEVIINTRWHIEDLSGYTQKAFEKSTRPFKIVSIPALVDEAAQTLLKRENDPVGFYDLNTSYWPEFWSTQELVDKKLGGTLSSADWNALYMQNPVPEEGNIVRHADFRFWPYEQPPECAYLILSVDSAFATTERADYSAYSLWGIFKHREVFDDESYKNTPLFGKEEFVPNMILLSAGKGKWEFPELCGKIATLYRKKQPDAILIEKKASGQSLIQELRRRGLPILEYMPDRDKESRLHACTPFFQSKRIWVPDNVIWAKDLISEVTSFPFAAHDDYVDCTSQAILWMRDNWKFQHEGYRGFMEDDEDEDGSYKKARRTYWNITAEKLH